MYLTNEQDKQVRLMRTKINSAMASGQGGTETTYRQIYPLILYIEHLENKIEDMKYDWLDADFA